MNSTTPFHAGELDAQARFGDPSIWDKSLQQKLLWEEIPKEFHARLESAPFFFLATSDDKGNCDCSFKGGDKGLIKVISGTQIAFPDFDGNGAFMSIGNIFLNPHVGLLFIDFLDGARLRVNGRASIHDTGDFLKLFTNAKRVVVVDIEQVVPNCSKHIPRLVFKDGGVQ
jgi:predicted pyridoxine 5'-phosphate oxidase superfamily flavin-nucleotide-binding protein